VSEGQWFVYLLLCESGRIYTGVTPVLDRRMTAHVKGRGALFTKLNRPAKLLAAKPFPSHGEALKVEKQVKKARAGDKRVLADIWARQHPVQAGVDASLEVSAAERTAA
jgi:putative endonuclease